jgi:hypothetical protein
MQKTVEQENEIERHKQLTRIRDRARVFQEVFGGPRGQLALKALKDKFVHALPPNVLDNNGRTDEYQTWRRLGHFDVMEYIHQQLTWKESEHVDTSSGST